MQLLGFRLQRPFRTSLAETKSMGAWPFLRRGSAKPPAIWHFPRLPPVSHTCLAETFMSSKETCFPNNEMLCFSSK